jgi:hypothetical protein
MYSSLKADCIWQDPHHAFAPEFGGGTTCMTWGVRFFKMLSTVAPVASFVPGNVECRALETHDEYPIWSGIDDARRVADFLRLIDMGDKLYNR